MSVVCKQYSANKAPQFIPKMHETVLTAVFPKCTKIYLPAYLKLVSDLRNRQLEIKNRDGDKAGRNFVFWVNFILKNIFACWKFKGFLCRPLM